MKRILSTLVCLVLLMGLVPPALAAGVSDVMQVYNCQEWVSLRDAPDTNAKRLEKVHLGELVLDCQAAANNFIQCEFNGKVGYILNTYLKTTAFSSGESFPGNQMVVNCTEWVSLREGPDTSSKQLAKVPLGAIVTACVAYYDSYISCEYKGKRGFIPTTYLKAANYSAGSQDAKVVAASEGKYPEINGPMTVVNCNEWVSLREKKSSASARLARVPLGAQVTNCVQVSDEFIYCCFNGLWGYIQAEYLAGPQQAANPGGAQGTDGGGAAFAALPFLPGYEAFMNAGSDLLVHDTFAGYTIVARRAYSDAEEMMAVCYDLNRKPLWELRDRSLRELSDVVQTNAFVGGVTEDALLIWYVSGRGFFAYAFGPQLNMRWALPESDALNITNSILTEVDHDGSIYAAYDDKVLCVSREGQLRWKTSCDDPGICFPMRFDISENYVDVTYDNHPETSNVVTVVRYSKDGFVLMQSVRVVSAEPPVSQ